MLAVTASELLGLVGSMTSSNLRGDKVLSLDQDAELAAERSGSELNAFSDSFVDVQGKKTSIEQGTESFFLVMPCFMI